MERIQEIWQEIKRTLDVGVGEWGLIALMGVVGLGSFGLGRLSALESIRPAVSITDIAAAAAPNAMPLGGQFVATRSGSVYYYPWCSGAQNIKPSDQVWFSTGANAQKAGYRPAKNCKGLSE